jgi:deoxycytidylate deaminase
MTCAKLVVKCILILPTGESFTGTNACANPQKECPRMPFEGYAKCKTVCQQAGHAETQAIAAAAAWDLTDALAVVTHNYVCKHCQDSLKAVGITRLALYPQ